MIECLTRAQEVAEADPDTRLAIAVKSPDTFPAEMLRLVGVTRRIPTYTSRATAIAAIREP